ncbi:uncharacterized protein EDB91DRAFT_1153532 [Suillus paluster]|uniref:uncharacterized protein n=1 Tax=Suillus paluster TaxID=48578 RepID=UPI001B87E78E|nr:uncharacterized protein EDB91DRAFT_1153532 [Suillus paluster]KAG1731605.1 hypothetical protein EDB91DRAFT_1153532 [Suillus paluster]
MITQSQNLALSPLNFNHYQNPKVEALWNELTENAVEPMLAPVPYLPNFSEECLLCAVVMMKMYDEQALLDLTALEQEVSYEEDPIGLVYVTAAPAQSAAQEASAGIIITDYHRRKGFGREAVELVLRWAFEELKFHRVQAAFMDGAQKDRAMRLFVGQGFTHEGTRRRSVFKPEGGGVVGVWKDVTYLAMLDTEWALRDTLRITGPAPTLWDELLARHAREREEMVKWDEKHSRIRKVSSTQTLRRGETPNQLDYMFSAFSSDAESSSSCQSSSYDMLQYLSFRESPRWSPLEDIDAASRQSSPSPYNFSIPSTPIPVPSRSPSVISSDSEFESEDEGDVAPSMRGLNRIPISGASSSSSQLSWTRRPLISRAGSNDSGSSESESWSDATDSGPDASGSDWDMMSEPERSS